jgi:hypothetical protein
MSPPRAELPSPAFGSLAGARSEDGPLRALRKLGSALQLAVPRRFAALPIAAWAALIWSASSMTPARAFPGIRLSAFTTNLLHAPLFGMLALLGCLALPRDGAWPRVTSRAALAVLAAVVLYGVADEIHQSFTPVREVSAFDVVTDGVGAACVLLVVAYVGRPSADRRGLSHRVLLGLAACALAAAAATWIG